MAQRWTANARRRRIMEATAKGLYPTSQGDRAAKTSSGVGMAAKRKAAAADLKAIQDTKEQEREAARQGLMKKRKG